MELGESPSIPNFILSCSPYTYREDYSICRIFSQAVVAKKHRRELIFYLSVLDIIYEMTAILL